MKMHLHMSLARELTLRLLVMGGSGSRSLSSGPEQAVNDNAVRDARVYMKASVKFWFRVLADHLLLQYWLQPLQPQQPPVECWTNILFLAEPALK